MLKTMGTPKKINAILLNIKISWPKLANVCRYELTTCWHNFMEIYLTWVKISQKRLRGPLFDSHCRCQATLFTKSGQVFLVHSSSPVSETNRIGQIVHSGFLSVLATHKLLTILCSDTEPSFLRSQAVPTATTFPGGQYVCVSGIRKHVWTCILTPLEGLLSETSKLSLKYIV